VGAYTDSRGNDFIRKEIAHFIERRDGYPANPDVSRCNLCKGGVSWGEDAHMCKLQVDCCFV